MKNERWQEVERLFDEARRHAPHERAEWLAKTCDDAELRAEVESLLRALEIPDELLDFAPSHKQVHIGPYRLLGVLGEGGMGTVYLAEQREPVRRRVAVKLIKLGMDSRQVLARFQAERQAIAMMEHTTIARVYDCGMTHHGQPYFAMEYVKGIPVTRYCDQQRLSVTDRLHLFTQVCAGVQHAHHKGIIHRDLTAKNILVSNTDGQPIPKIIDFGLARATDHRLLAQTLFTEQGQILGTPEYMSPEQAGFGGLDIDTRTDIYTLGVLLYELLVGELPFETSELKGAGLAEIQRRICETDPPRPSVRFSKLGSESRVTARMRQTETRELQKRLRGDLDWIVLRAMEKDRTRRYPTSSELAADIERHLAGEPVLARPPSLTYRLSKVMIRYRVQFAAASTALVALIVALLVSLVFYFEAEAARSQAESARRDADMARYRLDPQLLASFVTRTKEYLWPARQAVVPRMKDWLIEVGPLLARRPFHEEFLSREPEGSYVAEQGHKYLLDLERFASPRRNGTNLATVRARLDWAEKVQKVTVDRHRTRWERAIDAIRLHPEYQPLSLVPQVGLVPIGENPKTHLWEFYHVRSGAPDHPIPSHDSDGNIEVDEGTGIVFVLIPGGTLRMGAQATQEDGPNYDLQSGGWEGPPHEVTLSPFFMARHELSQAQWMRLSELPLGVEGNPSNYKPGQTPAEWKTIQWTNPVESVTWEQCNRLLGNHLLTLPTEAQWEYAARSRTHTPWWSGDQPESLEEVANIADETVERLGWGNNTPSWSGVNDGHAVHAPVDTNRANEFGLHNVHGNVWEHCLDMYLSYTQPTRPGDGLRQGTFSYRIHRGGSFNSLPVLTRSAVRNGVEPSATTSDLGVRAARRLENL